MKKILTLILIAQALCYATIYEYKVVYIAMDTSLKQVVVKESTGAYIDKARTKVLNNLGAEGWEIISIVGASNSDHALYLKRTVN